MSSAAGFVHRQNPPSSPSKVVSACAAAAVQDEEKSILLLLLCVTVPSQRIMMNFCRTHGLLPHAIRLLPSWCSDPIVSLLLVGKKNSRLC
jgi:hypothetical protein